MSLTGFNEFQGVTVDSLDESGLLRQEEGNRGTTSSKADGLPRLSSKI